MTEGLAYEGPGVTGAEGARFLGLVQDADGNNLAVGVIGGRVLIGDADDILGLSWELDAGQVEQLAQLIVRATWEASRHT